jgi:hypothetical protein
VKPILSIYSIYDESKKLFVLMFSFPYLVGLTTTSQGTEEHVDKNANEAKGVK